MTRTAALPARMAQGAAAAEVEEVTFVEAGALVPERDMICDSGEHAPRGLCLDGFAGVSAGSENGPVMIAGSANSPLRSRLRGDAEIEAAAFATDPCRRVDHRPRIGADGAVRGVVRADDSVRVGRFRDR
jgi:hypothetical protein